MSCYANFLSKQRTKSNDRDSNDAPTNFIGLTGPPSWSRSRGSGNWAALNRGLSALNRSRRVDGGRSRGGIGGRVKQDIVDEVDNTVRSKNVTGGDASGRIRGGDEDTR